MTVFSTLNVDIYVLVRRAYDRYRSFTIIVRFVRDTYTRAAYIYIYRLPISIENKRPTRPTIYKFRSRSVAVAERFIIDVNRFVLR